MWFTKQKFTYQALGRKYVQRELTNEDLENTTAILIGAGVDNLLSAMAAINGLLAGKKDESVAVPMDDYIKALFEVLSNLSLQGLLTQFVAALLHIPTDEAAKIPVTVTRSVVQDFFILNRGWLPIIQSFLSMKIQ